MAILYIEVVFQHEPSLRAEQDIKDAIQDFREAVSYLGKVTRADLVRATVAPPPRSPKGPGARP